MKLRFMKALPFLFVMSFPFLMTNKHFNTVCAQSLIAHYDFNNNFTDKLGGSVLDKFGTTSDGNLHDNATSSFSSDVNGNFWQWEASTASTRGGGLWIDVNSDISTNYSIGVRFSFTDTQGGYRKIIDYKDATSDNGFYFYSGGKFNFYPNTTLGLTTTTNNTVIDIIVTRNSTDKKFLAYIVNNGTMVKELEVTDNNSDAVPTLVNGKPRFRFFHDEVGTSREASRSGKVYSIKVWNGPITAIEAETAMEVKDFTWNGTNSNSTSAAQNWNENVSPGTNTNLTVPKLAGALPAYPIVSSNLTISKLNVKAGAHFTVSPATTFTVNDSIVLESDDNNTAQLISNGTLQNNSKLIFRKSFKASSGWYFMSFPYDVTLENIKRSGTQTTATTSDCRTATGPVYDDIYIIEYNGQRRDQTGTATSSNSPNWDPVTSGTLLAGKGYAFLVMTDKTIDFVSAAGSTGMFEATNKAATVETYGFNNNPAHRCWNLVGVPFTSSFNLANLDQNTFYYLYNQSGQNYEVKERADSYQVYPFSAFFMQASAATLGFAATGRALKAPMVSKEYNYDEIDLQLSLANFSDRTRIRFADYATTGYTINEDAVKMLSPNSSVPQLWTKSDVYDLSVNSLPASVREIPLILHTGLQGTYTIRLNNPENALQLQHISLLDTEKNQTIDLRQTNSYTFTAVAGKNTTRFKILTGGDVSTKIDEFAANEIKINLVHNLLKINGLIGEALVWIYDAAGKATQNFHKIKDGETITLQPLTGFYFVEIITDTQHHKEKVFIKN